MPVVRTKDSSHENKMAEDSALSKCHSSRAHAQTNPIPTRRNHLFCGLLGLKKKCAQEMRLKRDLKSTLDEADFSDLKAFSDRLVPITQGIIDLEPESTGRSTFHYRVATTLVNDFVDVQQKKYDMAYTTNLFIMLRRAIDSEQSAKELESALCVLAAFFVLMGPCLFQRLSTMEMLSFVLRSVPQHRSARVEKLRVLTCRCLTWSFSKMIDWDITDESVWRQVSRLVTPYILADDAEELVRGLLDQRQHQESNGRAQCGVRLAAMVVEALGGRSLRRCRTVASNVLQRMLLGHSDKPSVVPCGSSVSLDVFREIIALINKTSDAGISIPSSNLNTLKALSSVEISMSIGQLLKVFRNHVLEEVRTAVETVRNSGPMKLTDNTTKMWRILLRAARREQSSWRILSSVFISLIEEFRIKGAGKESFNARGIETHALRVANELWSVAKEDLKYFCRTAVAQPVLEHLFIRCYACQSSLHRTQDACDKFISEFVYAAPRQALSALKMDSAASDARRVLQLRTWCDVVAFTVFPDATKKDGKRQLCPDDLVAFLRFPYQMNLYLDRYTEKLWERLFFMTQSIAVSELLGDLPDNLKRRPQSLKSSDRKRRLEIDVGESSFNERAEEGGCRKRKRVH